MKKTVAVLLVVVLFVFGQGVLFANDRHHGHYRHRGHYDYRWHHGHHGHFFGHHHRVVVVGGYYPDPYWHYSIDGTALVLGTAVLGVSLVNGVVGAITSPFTTPFVEGTKRLAITENERTKREQIRSNAVLNAPGALMGDGNAEYSSTEGSARISASTPRSQPVYKQDAVKECSGEQLKQGRIEWGTSGKLKNLTTGESCFYDLR